MSHKILKIPISSRVYPELKEALENEAEELGLTTSLYLEDALQNRHFENEKLKEAMSEVEHLKSKLNKMQGYAQGLESKIETLKGKKKDLKVRHKIADDDIYRLNEFAQNLDSKIQPFRDLGISKLAPKNLTELDQYFAILEEKYPDLSRVELLLAALNRTVKNEKAMFIIHTISGHSFQ